MEKSDTKPKKRTRSRKPKDVVLNRNIDPSVRCPMCGDGELSDSLGNYSFTFRDKPMKVTDIPCRECDTCGGKRFVSEDIMRPVSYMKASGQTEVEYDEVMSFYWDWQKAVSGKN